MSICQHPVEKLGWLRSGSWGCKGCGWVAPISAVKVPWHIRHPQAVGVIIGSAAALIGILAVILVVKWIG